MKSLSRENPGVFMTPGTQYDESSQDIHSKNALVLTRFDPCRDPRPNRMIHWLTKEFNVSVIGAGSGSIQGVKSIQLRIPGSDQPFFHNIDLLATRFKDTIRSRDGINLLVPGLASIPPEYQAFRNHAFDLIVSHDLVLLPLAFHLASAQSKIIFDAREYYPKHFEEQWKWRITSKPLNIYLCRKYLPICDRVITVSDGIAKEYHKEFGVLPQVIMSLPEFVDTQPSPVDDNHIRMIHHGWASPSRRIELMIEMMDYVDPRFTLDLMLIPGKGSYWDNLIKMAESRRNVRIVPPVPMQNIVRATNSYDIGLYLLPPTNFNSLFALPNKFFEFIQARLAVAIGPSIEMEKLIDTYGCGIISRDFSPGSLAKELNSLDSQTITQLKIHSHNAAQILNADENGKKVMAIVHELCGTAESVSGYE